MASLYHRGPARFLVDLGHISGEKKYILGKKYYLPNIYFFSTDMCPKSTKKRAGPLWLKLQNPVVLQTLIDGNGRASQ